MEQGFGWQFLLPKANQGSGDWALTFEGAGLDDSKSSFFLPRPSEAFTFLLSFLANENIKHQPAATAKDLVNGHRKGPSLMCWKVRGQMLSLIRTRDRSERTACKM